MGGEGSGRPPISDSRASEWLRIRITARDKATIYQAAKARGVSASQFILEAALRAAARVKKKSSG